jgi:hypothetical protein
VGLLEGRALRFAPLPDEVPAEDEEQECPPPGEDEAALHALVCPPSVLAAQLDRLAGAIGLDTVELGIIPLSASLKIPPATAFWIYDDRQVIVENWHAELWIDDEVSMDTCLRTWKTLRESAVYDADAHRLISAARRALQPPTGRTDNSAQERRS